MSLPNMPYGDARNKWRREQACRVGPKKKGKLTRTRNGEVFSLVGRVDKTFSTGVGVYVSDWRGDTRIELHELERVISDYRRSGTCIFLTIDHIDELIALLQQALEAARSLSAPAKKVAVRKRTKPQGKETTHDGQD